MDGNLQGYRTPARLLHWIVVLLVLAMIPAGVIMVQEGLDRSFQNSLFIFHKNMGVVLFFLIVVRLVYRRFNPPPPLPASVSGLQKFAAEATHYLLYGLLILMPIAGYIRVRAGGFPIEGLDAMGVPALVPRSEALASIAMTLHFIGGLALAAIILMHVGAAILHGLFLKDGVFSPNLAARRWPRAADRPAHVAPNPRKAPQLKTAPCALPPFKSVSTRPAGPVSGNLFFRSPRWALAILTLGFTGAVLAVFVTAVQVWSPWSVAATLLMSASVLWIAGGAATGLVGLAFRPAPLRPAPDGWSPTGNSAILVTLCREDAVPVAHYLSDLHATLQRAGLQERLRIFVLSDTSTQPAKTAESTALRALVESGAIQYRRRPRNIGRKPGNIADWLKQHGKGFRYMLVLDADSRMSLGRILRKIWYLDTHPRTGLLQAGMSLTPARSRFGRFQRVSARLLGPVFVRGFAAWTGRSGNYWGHNALIRTEAFRVAAALPQLSGRAPFGGDILSHDFIEAAWIRRAGWAVEMDPDTRGSLEDSPQSLAAFCRRDRRWCQGNLQHLRVIAAPGLHWVSRLHIAAGIFSYLAAPLWLALLCLLATGAVTVTGVLPFALIALLLLAPKLCGMSCLLARRMTPWRRSVVLRAFRHELVFSALLAPLVMVRQVGAVIAVLLGRDSGWKAGTARRQILPYGVAEMLVGGGILALALAMDATAALWLAPVLVPLLMAPFIFRFMGSAT